MTAKTVRRIIWLAGVLWFPAGAAAGPKVAIDTLEVNFGTVYEIKSRFLTHIFNIKNTGDSPLEIYNIRAGCGCTTFMSDSVVQPGKAGHITMRLDLSEVRGGTFYKYLKVSTNCRNYPRARFAFYGVLKPIIHVDSGAIVLPTIGKKDTVQTVTLFTEKPDLQVTEVSFVIDNPPFEWQSNLPIRFQFRKTGKKNSEGLWSYTLQVFYSPVQKESWYGNFIVTTNHPDKPELKITGFVNPMK
jgi:hypothetical protein